MKWILLRSLIIVLLLSSVHASQVRDYWFDACHWDGVSGEVLDHSENSHIDSRT